MQDPYFSFIIPVFNRPQEIEELLQSMLQLDFNDPFEIVIIEDGSSITSKNIVDDFKDRLSISYYFKENSGPGDSRNFGMQKAKGDYFLILDSDVILPSDYLQKAKEGLQNDGVDCFGGVDTAHESFSDLQKAIDVVMTSFLTTGGIRGGGEQLGKFQPRSFNMGLSKKAFEVTQGFGNIHPGEDPDLSMRLWKLGFKTALFSEVKVFHKRRISWKKFWQQVTKFGKCRPILNSWHPESKKLTYWFPTVFSLGLLIAFVLYSQGQSVLIILYTLYFSALAITALVKYKSIKIMVMSILAAVIQFLGYGRGFLISTFQVNWLKKDPRKIFPKLFFN